MITNYPILLFAGSTYYPCGGWEDYIGSFQTEEEALKRVVNSSHWDWWHIVDLRLGQSNLGEIISRRN